MKKILSVNDVRLSDIQTIQSGTPSKELMYRAALGVYNSYTWNGNIGIFCGSGNSPKGLIKDSNVENLPEI